MSLDPASLEESYPPSMSMPSVNNNKKRIDANGKSNVMSGPLPTMYVQNETGDANSNPDGGDKNNNLRFRNRSSDEKKG